MKNLFIFALTALLLASCAGNSPSPSNPPAAASPESGPAPATQIFSPPAPEDQVDLKIEHGVVVPGEGFGPSFGIQVSGWQPNGEVTIYIIGPGGEQVSIVPMEKPAYATQEGEIGLLVPYEMKGLYPGMWILLVGGPSGIHTMNITIPKVIPPSGGSNQYTLDFDAAKTPVP